MKKKTCSKFSLFLISAMLGLIIVSGTVSATIYSTEDFEDEANNANPSASWYTYSESGLTVSNVSNANAYGGSQAFYLNDSANSADSYANFAFNTITYYDNFYFRFNITNADWHNSTNVTFTDSSGNRLGYFNITNTTIYFNNHTQVVVGVTISANNWYRAYIDFNLTTGMIGAYFYNESNSSELMGSGWANMHTGLGSYVNVANVNLSADTGTKTSIWIDDFNRAYTYINPNQANVNAITSAVSVLLIVAILLVIISFALTGAITPTQLIYIAVISIIGVVTAMIVAGTY